MPPLPISSPSGLGWSCSEAPESPDTHGKQVVDFWALNPLNPDESLSMAYTHGVLCKLTPGVGDILYSNSLRAMMILSEDTTLGVHDTLASPYDEGLCKLLGAEGYHRSCTDKKSIIMLKHYVFQNF